MSDKLNSPIVLAHGLLGFSRFQLGEVTLASYFNRIPECLRETGNVVFQSEVPATGSIADRAAALKAEIDGFVKNEPVHIIAHSMGGLDARFMISRLDMGDRVHSLTTIGTPHRGTAFADHGLDVANRFGVVRLVRELGIPQEAFWDLKPERCAEFNESTPDLDSVRYFSVSGARKREELLVLLRYSWDVIHAVEGDNDGLVSVESARWGEAHRVWECDHLNMVGWISPWNRWTNCFFDFEGGYAEILADLASCGF